MTTEIVLLKDWNRYNWHWFIKHIECMENSIEDISPYDTPFYQHIGEYYRDLLEPFNKMRQIVKGMRGVSNPFFVSMFTEFNTSLHVLHKITTTGGTSRWLSNM